MLEAPEHWDELWGESDTQMQLRFRIYNSDDDILEFTEGDMLASDCKVTHQLYDTYGTGNVCIGKLTVALYTDAQIAGGARKCTLECRLARGLVETDWVPQGTFYLNSVEKNGDGSVYITAYDPIALLDQDYYYPGGVLPTDYPEERRGIDVIDEACDIAGLGRITNVNWIWAFSHIWVRMWNYTTYRDLLKALASSADGNFTATKDGRMRFLPIGNIRLAAPVADLSAADVVEVSDVENVTAVTGTDGMVSYTEGDASDGIMLEITRPDMCGVLDAYGEPAIKSTVQNVLGRLESRTYHGVKLDGVYASPLLELGDCVTVNGGEDAFFADSFSLLYEQGLWGEVSAPLKSSIEQRLQFASRSSLNSNISSASSAARYNLPPATDGALGGVIVGDGISVELDGTISALTCTIPYAHVDSTSTAWVYTATLPDIDEYRDGLCVLLNNDVVSSVEGFTININSLGAKPVYTNLATATAETTKFRIGYTMMFVYDSTRVSGGCWVCYNGYDSNTNTIGYQVRTNSTTLAASDGFVGPRLLLTSADGTRWVPANTSTSTSATTAKPVNQRAIDPFGPIVYYSGTATVTEGSGPSVTVIWQQYAFNLGYSFNSTGRALSLTSHAPVYLKCAPQDGGGAIMQGIVQALPSSEDGFIYIFLGIASSATGIELRLEHPVYYFAAGALRMWTGQALYAGDESLPDTTSGGLANPDKNIIVDNEGMTIQANMLTAAQTAALLT